MTLVHTWSVACQGGGDTAPCGSWAGREATEEEARDVARAHGWLLAIEGEPESADLCPRCRRGSERSKAR
jgi:hypothetical protein